MQGYGMPAALFPRGRRGLPLYEYLIRRITTNVRLKNAYGHTLYEVLNLNPAVKKATILLLYWSHIKVLEDNLTRI
jgi:hypothetical protein